MRKFEVPIERIRPSCCRAMSAFQVPTASPADGAGQWIR